MIRAVVLVGLTACVHHVPVDGPTLIEAGYHLVRIEPGRFFMGSIEGEWGTEPDEHWHDVVLTRPYLIGATEVTQGLWEKVMGSNPSDCDLGCGAFYPVNRVSWDDAVEFANRLSNLEGLLPVYVAEGDVITTRKNADGYRLPTEAEWEYAARANRWRLFAGAEQHEEVCKVANVNDPRTRAAYKGVFHENFDCDDGFPGLAPVASRVANEWGLYDLTGNVWEWVFDAHGDYRAVGSDPVQVGGSREPRVFRGGSWKSDASAARLAERNYSGPKFRRNDLGLRLARDVRR